MLFTKRAPMSVRRGTGHVIRLALSANFVRMISIERNSNGERTSGNIYCFQLKKWQWGWFGSANFFYSISNGDKILGQISQLSQRVRVFYPPPGGRFFTKFSNWAGVFTRWRTGDVRPKQHSRIRVKYQNRPKALGRYEYSNNSKNQKNLFKIILPTVYNFSKQHRSVMIKVQKSKLAFRTKFSVFISGDELFGMRFFVPSGLSHYHDMALNRGLGI